MSVFSDRLVIVLLISLFYCIDIVQCLQMKSSKLNMNLLNVSKPRTNTIQKKNYISVDNISNQKFRLVEVPEPHEIIETEIEFLPTGGINIREICQNSNRSKVTNSIVTRASWRSTYGDKNLLEMIIERTIQGKFGHFLVTSHYTANKTFSSSIVTGRVREDSSQIDGEQIKRLGKFVMIPLLE